MIKFILLLILLFICVPAFSQPSTVLTFSVTDDNTTVDNPWKLGVNGADVVNNGDGSANININYDNIGCDILNDNYCFKFSQTVLTLYVNGTAQWQWPEAAAAEQVVFAGENVVFAGENVVFIP